MGEVGSPDGLPDQVAKEDVSRQIGNFAAGNWDMKAVTADTTNMGTAWKYNSDGGLIVTGAPPFDFFGEVIAMAGPAATSRVNPITAS